MDRTNNSSSATTEFKQPSIEIADIIKYAKHSAKTPQTKNDKGQIVRGTTLVIYMGYKHSLIEWIDERGNERVVPKLALVFAVKLQSGSYKNIVFKTPYAIAPNSNLELALKSLGVTPEYLTSEDEFDSELFDDDVELNKEKLHEDLDAIRGLSYLVEIENKQSKKGRYYNDIDLSTLIPYTDKTGTHKRVREPENCDVSAVKIDFSDY